MQPACKSLVRKLHNPSEPVFEEKYFRNQAFRIISIPIPMNEEAIRIGMDIISGIRLSE